MSPIDAEQRDVEQSVDEGETDNSRFVPVTESIRYRRRAQSAEKKNELLTEELASVKTQGEQMQRRLKELELEGSLMRRLAGAGVVDLETAVLLAKARCEGQEKVEPDDVIEQLKREKQYLFGQGCGASFVPGKTSGPESERQV